MASPAKTTTPVQETGADRKAEPMGYPATRGAAGIPASDPAERLQALAGNQAVATFFRYQPLAGAGQPLASHLRDELEGKFGEDLDDVRIHAGFRAAEAARAVNAKAYTFGRDIVFGADRYAPDSFEGRRLLAHELAHVIQQRRGGAVVPITRTSALEQAAQDAARSVMASQTEVTVVGASGVGIAREEEPKDEEIERALSTWSSFDQEPEEDARRPPPPGSRAGTSDPDLKKKLADTRKKAQPDIDKAKAAHASGEDPWLAEARQKNKTGKKKHFPLADAHDADPKDLEDQRKRLDAWYHGQEAMSHWDMFDKTLAQRGFEAGLSTGARQDTQDEHKKLKRKISRHPDRPAVDALIKENKDLKKKIDKLDRIQKKQGQISEEDEKRRAEMMRQVEANKETIKSSPVTALRSKAKGLRDRLAISGLTDPDNRLQPSKGAYAGRGENTYAVLQIIGPDGRIVAAATGQRTNKGHAERNAIAQLNLQIQKLPGGKVPPGSRVEVVGDQVVCTKLCKKDLAAFAEAHDLDRVDGYTFHANRGKTKAGADQISSAKTTARNVTRASTVGKDQIEKKTEEIYERGKGLLGGDKLTPGEEHRHAHGKAKGKKQPAPQAAPGVQQSSQGKGTRPPRKAATGAGGKTDVSETRAGGGYAPSQHRRARAKGKSPTEPRQKSVTPARRNASPTSRGTEPGTLIRRAASPPRSKKHDIVPEPGLSARESSGRSTAKKAPVQSPYTAPAQQPASSKRKSRPKPGTRAEAPAERKRMPKATRQAAPGTSPSTMPARTPVRAPAATQTASAQQQPMQTQSPPRKPASPKAAPPANIPASAGAVATPPSQSASQKPPMQAKAATPPSATVNTGLAPARRSALEKPPAGTGAPARDRTINFTKGGGAFLAPGSAGANANLGMQATQDRGKGITTGQSVGFDGAISVDVKEIPGTEPKRYRVTMNVSLGAQLNASASKSSQGQNASVGGWVQGGAGVSGQFSHELSADEAEAYRTAAQTGIGGAYKELEIARMLASHRAEAAQTLLQQINGARGSAEAVKHMAKGDASRVTVHSSGGAGVTAGGGRSSRVGVMLGVFRNGAVERLVEEKDGKIVVTMTMHSETGRTIGGSASQGAAGMGVSDTRAENRLRSMSFTLDPSDAEFDRKYNSITAVRTVEQLSALGAAGLPPSASATGKGASRGNEVSANVLGLGARFNVHGSFNEQEIVDERGVSHRYEGSGGGGLDLTVGDQAVSSYKKQDAFVADVGPDNMATGETSSTKSETDLTKSLAATAKSFEHSPVTTVTGLASGKTKVLQERVDTSGASLTNDSFGQLAELAKDGHAWGKAWTGNIDAFIDWQKTRHKVLAANGDRNAIARAMAEFESNGPGRSGTVEKATQGTSIVFEFPDELADQKPVYDQYVVGNPIGHARELAKNGQAEAALNELRAANDKLGQLKEKARGHAGAFASERKLAEMNAHVDERRSQLRNEIRALTPKPQAEPMPAGFAGPPAPQPTRQDIEEQERKHKAEELRMQESEILKNVSTLRARESETFAYVRTEMDDWHWSKTSASIRMAESLTRTKKSYEPWDKEVSKLRDIYKALGEDAAKADSYGPDRKRWDAVNAEWKVW